MPWAVDPSTPAEQAQGGFLSRWMGNRPAPMAAPGAMPGSPLGAGYVIDPYQADAERRRKVAEAQQKQAYFDSVAAMSPASQTTQAPPQLPGFGPMDSMGPDEGVPGAMPQNLPLLAQPEPAAAPAQTTPQPRTDPAAFALLDSRDLPPPAALPGMGTDPSVFAGLDAAQSPYAGQAPAPANTPFSTPERLTAPTDPQRSRQGTLTKEQLDAQWALMVPGESGGRVDAVNGTSKAAGLTQFIPSTLNAFLASPAGQGQTRESYMKDPAVQRMAFDWLTQGNAKVIEATTGKAPDAAALAAAHALGAGGASSLMLAPNANAFEAYNARNKGARADVVFGPSNRAWGVTPTDTSAQALQKIGSYYQNAAAKGGAVAASPAASAQAQATPLSNPAAPVASEGAQKAPDPFAGGPTLPTELPGRGPGDMGADLPAGYQPVTASDRMMALAGGILSGSSLTDGFGKGIQAQQKLQFDGQDRLVRAREQQANTALLRERLGLVNAQTIGAQQAPTLALQRVQQADRRIDGTLAQGDRRLDITEQGMQLRAEQSRLAMEGRQQAIQLRERSVANAEENSRHIRSGMKGLTEGTVKDSLKIAEGLTTDVTGAATDLTVIANLRELIGKEGITGNNVKQEIQRFAADRLGINLGVTPEGYSLAEKEMATFNNNAALGVGKGIVARLTQGELFMFQKGFLNMGTQPEAALAMLDNYEKASKRRLDIGQRWTEEMRSDPTKAQQIMAGPGGLRGWYEERIGEQLASRRIDSNPNTHTPSQYTRTDGGGWQNVAPVGGAPAVRFRINQ